MYASITNTLSSKAIQNSDRSFDVEIADLTGQIIPQNHAFYMEQDFASKDDGDMAATFGMFSKKLYLYLLPNN